jgi:hypothetical protein
VVPPKDVPERFKDAIAAGAVTDKQPERAPEQQPSEAVMAMSDDRTNAGTLPEKSQVNPRHDRDADLDGVEHEQGPTVVFWSGDYGAELERLKFDQETQSERGRSEPPERGIEDDEELER